jgi:hopanoid biosynthesis associated radical SAM protein HpnH
LFAKEDPDEVAEFFDFAMGLGVEAITVSPGYHYEHAPRHDVFLGRVESKTLFREVFARGRARQSSGGRRWLFNHSSLYLDFLAGNQSYQCTPWSNPTFNVFGWQRPCYLMSDEGYAPSFRSLMEDTAWERYGVGRDPRCDNCMAHCGFEGTAVNDMLRHPLKALRVALSGPRLGGPMAPELPFLYQEKPATPQVVAVPISAVGRERRTREAAAADVE